MFSLTRQERQVILFLFTLALLGAGVNFAVRINSRSKIMPAFCLDLGKVDLNKADKGALMEVPGVGEKLAQRILEYRGRQGSFRQTEELKNIAGINAYRYERLKDYLIVK